MATVNSSTEHDISEISDIVDAVNGLLESVMKNVRAVAIRDREDPEGGRFGPVSGLHWAMCELTVAVRKAKEKAQAAAA